MAKKIKNKNSLYLKDKASNMNYNPDNQYRCTIIRGKSISKMDDLLPIYSEILNDICPIPTSQFAKIFDYKLTKYIKDNKKTIRNHRTENAGKLLGMYFEKDGIVNMTERTQKFLKDNDQPALFKSVCFRFQQPNGSQKIQTIRKKCDTKICFKPYHFVIRILKIANDNETTLTKNEIAYYVLNSLDTLQGKVSPETVYNRIISDRNKKIINKVETPGKAYSYSIQHINEQYDHLELSNLIRKDNKHIWLNNKEKKAIDTFIKDFNNPISFKVCEYNLEGDKIGNQITRDWQEYFGQISKTEINSFYTTLDSLDLHRKVSKPILDADLSTIELGDEGEDVVLKIEKDRVKSFNPRLVNKVNYHGKMKGLGYDITSIEADRNPKNPEFFRYIEVKSTKRVHPPKFIEILDSINLTRNEWVAAEQHSKHYYIYRVYFTNHGIFISVINNPVKKNEERKLFAVPINYRLEFNDKAVDEKLIL
ncbi:MAG: DUF3883 domain-containing protein [Ignavibacteria bacterium]|nr:DUF3883 domain-containing protein [Ignavibacteria bacterium]